MKIAMVFKSHFVKHWKIKRKLVICDAWRNFAPFVQFKELEKHRWKSDNFSRAAGWSLQLKQKYYSSMGVFYIVKIVHMVQNLIVHMVQNRTKHHIMKLDWILHVVPCRNPSDLPSYCYLLLSFSSLVSVITSS